MSIMLKMPEELETNIRDAASSEGIAPDQLIMNILQQHLWSPNQLPDLLSEAEADLLEQINLGLSEEMWEYYESLIEKRQAGTLSPEEQHTLISISDQIEVANANRMAALIKLAHLRHTPLDILMIQLGIFPRSHA